MPIYIELIDEDKKIGTKEISIAFIIKNMMKNMELLKQESICCIFLIKILSFYKERKKFQMD